MSAQHTQGLLVVDACETHDSHLLGCYVAHEGGGRVAQTFVNCLVRTENECRANARLFTAAPDFLAAARLIDEIWGFSFDLSKDADGCSGWGPGEVDAISALRAAIIKATGGAS